MSNSANNTMVTAKSYLDFGGLGELRAKTERNDRQALKETAQQFEAMMIQQMLKSMREANNALKSDLTGSHAEEMYQGMFDQEVAVQLSKRDQVGLSKMLVQHLDRMQQQPSTQAILKQRSESQKGLALNPPAVAMPLVNAPRQAGLALEPARGPMALKPSKMLGGNLK